MATEPSALEEQDGYAARMLVPSPVDILELAARAPLAPPGPLSGHPDLSWFDAADLEATTAICTSCPVAGPCGEAGRYEAAGVWGGLARTLVTRSLLRTRRAPRAGTPSWPR